MRKLFSTVSWTLVSLIVIVGIGATIRFWNFVPSVMFQGDQARDALIVADIFLKKDIVLIGPVMSVGNIYLGPLYYYFMLPWLWLSYPSPLGPVLAVAVLNCIGIVLMYVMGKEIVGKHAALLSSVFFAFSSVLIDHSRFSWNPNPIPVVMIIILWATHRALTRKPWYWLITAVGFSIILQLHYITLLTLAGLGLLWLYHIYLLRSSSVNRQTWLQFVVATIASIVIFIASLTPLILFDLRHDGLNRKAFLSIFTQSQLIDQDHISLWQKIGLAIYHSEGRALMIGYDHLFGHQRVLGDISLIALLLVTLIAIKKGNSKHHLGLVIIVLFWITTITATSLYGHSLFIHYMLYMFPIIFWWWAYWLTELRSTWWGKLIILITITSFITFNISRYTLEPPDWTILDVKTTADRINQSLQPGEKYSLVLLGPSKDSYALNYRYFLNTTNTPPLPIEKSGDANTLVVIDEEHATKVADVPIYEIVIFPNKSNPTTLSIPGGPEISIFRR